MVGVSRFGAWSGRRSEASAQRLAVTSKHVQRSCLNKRRYATQADASVNALHRSKKGLPPLRPYSCKVCKGWHLTKKLQRAAEPVDK